MNESTGVEYMKSWQLGEAVLGLAGVGIVLRSKSPQYNTGDLVQAQFNWPWMKVFKCRTDDPLFKLTKVC